MSVILLAAHLFVVGDELLCVFYQHVLDIIE